MIHHSGELSLRTTNGKWTAGQSWNDYINSLAQRQQRIGDLSSTVEGGLVIEGNLVEVRSHRLLPAPAQNFMVLTIDVEHAKKRTFDVNGKETSDFNKPKEELVRKGYLHHHDVRTIDDPAVLTIPQLSSILKGFYSSSTSDAGAASTRASRLEFWGDVGLIKPMNLNTGDRLHLKTRFDSAPIIEGVTVHKVTQSKTYHGEDVVGGWGGKIFSQKDAAAAAPTPSASAPGDKADDDEWN